MFEFKSKAETLKSLEAHINTAVILPQVSFSVAEWENDRDGVFNKLKNAKLFDELLIVRSSARNEDSNMESLAGKFKSVLNVQGRESIEKAVETVILSYQSKDGDNLLLIQPMLKNVRMFGIAFSVDPNTGGNYIVINYDNSGSTSCLTNGGTGAEYKTYYHFKGADFLPPFPLDNVVRLIHELEHIFQTNCIDIEFAIDSNGTLYLFQVRPLILKVELANMDEQQAILKRISDKIKSEQRAKPYLFGNRTIYGVMPDWNPAEIIGTRPKPLALSLYKELICDDIWAYQRDNYGYKNLRSFPLLINFAGLPYIDVRVSFNSFLPKELDECLSAKLSEYYVDCLIRNPEYHDKVEFEIVFSCYTLDIDEKLKKLSNLGFDFIEIENIKTALRKLTNFIIDIDNGYLQKDINKIAELEKRRDIILKSDLDKVSKIYWLLEDCKRYGTLPFAGLARGGFVAIAMLKSMVSVGILTNDDYQNYLGGLNSINSDMISDYKRLSKHDFLYKYGHLRPGTYDILSKRYDEDPDRYFDFTKLPKDIHEDIHIDKKVFSLSLKQLNEIKKSLEKHDLSCDTFKLFDFMKMAIEGREYSKFVFTKSLSEALKLFSQLAEKNGFRPEDAAYSDISIIKRCYSSENDIYSELQKSIDDGKARYKHTQSICLPPLIRDYQEVYSFYQMDGQPNFITLKSMSGKVCNINDTDLKDKIIFIESADPGYDWIFSKGIQGFVTMYGGANSHMAIRAGELQIPAVIGMGEKLFNYYINAESIEINCSERRIQIIK